MNENTRSSTPVLTTDRPVDSLTVRPFRRLRRLRTTLLVVGILSAVTAPLWQILGNVDGEVFPFAFVGAVCLVGAGNAMIWIRILARRPPTWSAQAHKVRTVGLVALLAVASIAVVAVMMYAALVVFFQIMAAGVRL
jgi:hypothetical protein